MKEKRTGGKREGRKRNRDDVRGKGMLQKLLYGKSSSGRVLSHALLACDL